jgi:hypothetical protein
VTRGERMLHRRRFGLLIATLLFLGGGVTVALLLIAQEAHRAGQVPRRHPGRAGPDEGRAVADGPCRGARANPGTARPEG